MIKALVPSMALAAGLALTGGCEINSFLDPGEPNIRQKDSQPLVVPVLDYLDRSIEEPDTAFNNASDVQPDDLVATAGSYKIGKNDVITVTIYDLLGLGSGPTTQNVRVSESGTITLPFIKPVKAEGLTEGELQDEIANEYKAEGQLQNARVSVQVSEFRGRTFEIAGNATNPGEFQILKSNFRLLDALVQGRAPAQREGVEYCYIVRQTGPNAGNPSGVPAAQPAGGVPPVAPAAPTTPPTQLTPPPSTDPLAPTSQAPAQANTRVALMEVQEGPATAATTNPSDMLAPGAGDNATGMVEGRPMDVHTPATAPAAAQGNFQFNELTPPADVRVIRVPLQKLLDGDLRYNVVIHPSDVIIIPDPVTGEYYMAGHVQRTGVYSLTGRRITLKQAVVSAGMFDQLAIPQRSEVIRRIGANREVFARIDLDKVWAGEQPDIFLKPNDIVQVGTNALAPFLSAIRNSFRLTYGFGFLYDRNFAYNNNGQAVGF